jgi:hypothetical protein
MLGETQSLIAFNSASGNTTYDCGGVLFFSVQGNARGRLTSTGLKIGPSAPDPTEALDVTGNILASGSITASSVIVGSTNLMTELTSLDERLDAEEPKTSALQSLTATHTTDIASLNTRLDTEEPKITALQSLTATHTTDIASLDTRLDTEEAKITALQSLTATHTTDIASNTANILSKQPLITSATDLECNSLTTTQLEVNGGVNIIIPKPQFDTIVIRRLDETSTTFINLNELQCWVNGINIMIHNGLTSYFAMWEKNDVGVPPFFASAPASKIYNNNIESTFGAQSGSNANALIIKKHSINFYTRDTSNSFV